MWECDDDSKKIVGEERIFVLVREVANAPLCQSVVCVLRLNEAMNDNLCLSSHCRFLEKSFHMGSMVHGSQSYLLLISSCVSYCHN